MKFILLSKKLIFSLILISTFSGCRAELNSINGQTYFLYADQIKDSFSVSFRTSISFDASRPYYVVFATDATLGIGNYLLAKDSNWMAELPPQTVIAAIGHTGKTEVLRRRDFIPSDAGGYKDPEFGHADKFYQFLKGSIVPFVKEKFPKQKKAILIGHSFGGLFCLYAALQNEHLFDEYYAISPSVWANHEELLKIEKRYSGKHNTLPVTIHIYAGGLEFLNKVLSSSRKFHETVKSRNYEGVTNRFDIIGNANHLSIRKPAVDRILKTLK